MAQKANIINMGKSAAVAARPQIDYPAQDEKIDSREYSLRISASEAGMNVDVSIDQGPWLPCRKASGHWWYDWSGYDAGEHEVIARTRATESSRWVVSLPHEFFVNPLP